MPAQGKSALPPPPGGRRAPPPPPSESEEAPPPLPSRPTPGKPGGSSTPAKNGPPLRPSPDDSYIEPNQWTSNHGKDEGPPLPPRPPNINTPSGSSDSSFQDEEYEEPGMQVSAPPPLPPHPNAPKSIKQPSHQAAQEPHQEEEYSELDGVGMVEPGPPSPVPNELEQEEYDEFEIGENDGEDVQEETYEAPENQQDTYEEVPNQIQHAAPKHPLPSSSKAGVPLPPPPASSDKNLGAPGNKPQETYEEVPAQSQPNVPTRPPPSSAKMGVPLPPPPSDAHDDKNLTDLYETLPEQRTPTPPLPPPPSVSSQKRPVPPPSPTMPEESRPEVPDRSKQEIPKTRAAAGMPLIGQDQLDSARKGLKQTNSKSSPASGKQTDNVQSQGDFRSTLEKFKNKEQGNVPANTSKFSAFTSKNGDDKSSGEETVAVGLSVKERLTILMSDKTKKSGIAASCPIQPSKPIPPPKENKYLLQILKQVLEDDNKKSISEQAKAHPTILKPKPVMAVTSFSPPLPPPTNRIPSSKKQTETKEVARPKSPTVENDQEGWDQEEIYDDALSKPQDPLSGQKWFKDVERQQANTLVKRKDVDGAYMVRTSSGKETDQPYSLVVLYKNHVYNLKIRHKKDGRYALGEEKSDELTFKDVPELIVHHTKHAVMLVNNKENKQYETILTVFP